MTYFFMCYFITMSHGIITGYFNTISKYCSIMSYFQNNSVRLTEFEFPKTKQTSVITMRESQMKNLKVR